MRLSFRMYQPDKDVSSDDDEQDESNNHTVDASCNQVADALNALIKFPDHKKSLKRAKSTNLTIIRNNSLSKGEKILLQNKLIIEICLRWLLRLDLLCTSYSASFHFIVMHICCTLQH